MSALASLVRAYERMGSDAPPFGYSRTNVSFSIRIGKDGRPTCAPIDFRAPFGKGKKLVGPKKELPTFLVQRTSGIDANFLWDKTQYSLGIAKADPKKTLLQQAKDASRAIEMHASFVDLHRKHLSNETDDGLVALLTFLEIWSPEQFDGWPDEMKGENIVFELDGDKRGFIHERPAAHELWMKILAAEPAIEAVCLVDGIKSRAPLSHPPIKGVTDAQPSGAFIVSFNRDAFTSYGHEAGENAPVSEAAAFAYTTALNHFLERDSGHRVQIGDASTVFWADASDAAAAEEAEDEFAFLMGVNEKEEETRGAKKVGVILDAVRQGKPLAELKPDPWPGVRFYVLGLSPNAARLSVRFYIEDDFANIAENFLLYLTDLRLEPKPEGRNISINSILLSLVPASLWKKSIKDRLEMIPNNWAGEYFRTILAESAFPGWITGSILARVRSDRVIDWTRVSALKGDHIRNLRKQNKLKSEDYLVTIDAACPEPGYILGRLFAVREQIQWAALGDVGSSLKDKFYASASVYPERVFAAIDRYSTAHLARLRREKPGLKVNLEKDLAAIMQLFDPDKGVPQRLDNDQQALFAIGYYHQKEKYLAGKPKDMTKDTNAGPENHDGADH